MVATPAKQAENVNELASMIKALVQLKESRPSLTFVKTGVSNSALPKFLVDQDIVGEDKRSHLPSPMAELIANTDRPISFGQPVRLSADKSRKKTLRKSERLMRLSNKAEPKEATARSKRSELSSAKSLVAKPRQRKRHRGIWRWLEELAVIMSKMSLFGLFLVLLLLGSVFFGVGFLAAVSNNHEKSNNPTWQQASHCQNQAAGSAKTNPFLRTISGVASSLVDQKVAGIESKLGGGILNQVVGKVPPSLQPFALQMQNKFSQQSQAIVGSGGRAVKQAFSPSSFGSTPPPPPPAQPATTTPQRAVPVFGGAHFGRPVAVPAAQPNPMHRYTESEQAFRHAGQVAVRHEQQPPSHIYAPQPEHYQQGYANQAGNHQIYPPQAPQPQYSARQEPMRPQSNNPGYYSQPPVSQPYGASDPYGYSMQPRAPQQNSRMVGMG